MINAILGRKLGMTRIFNEYNEVMAVTVIQAGPCKIAQVKKHTTDGYNAVQLCFGNKKLRNITKPLFGHLRKNNINFYPEAIKEVKVENVENINPGYEVNISIFTQNELVDVQGYTKGKGFSGVVKRWGFGGGP
ncbi:MAG: 50S ribosomal protein L3, partial [Endomicrobiia bacterium]